MNRRTLAATSAAALLAPLLMSSAASAKAPDHNSGLIMTGDDQVSVIRGSEQWINIGWTAPDGAENVRMTVTPDRNGVTIGYADEGSSAGLAQDADLAPGEMDVASFMLATTVQAPTKFDLDITATWTVDGESFSEDFDELEVKLAKWDGDDYAFTTDSATILSGPASAAAGDAGQSNWIEMGFLGISPLNDDFSITVKKGIDEDFVYYPQNDYTSLHHNTRLDLGEEDVARIWIDPALVDPGETTIEITVEFTDNEGKKQKNKHTFDLTVL